MANLKNFMADLKNFILLLTIFSLGAYPIGRAAGAIYQSSRGNGIVNVSKKRMIKKYFFKGACVRYDAVDEILIAVPFENALKCWNGADWTVIIASFSMWPAYPVFILFGDDNEDRISSYRRVVFNVISKTFCIFASVIYVALLIKFMIYAT